MLRVQCIIIAILLALITPTLAEQKPPTGLWLDYASMKEEGLPAAGDIPYLLTDFEYLEGETPKVFALDVNEDSIQDYFVESSKRTCGTGGCAYALVEGRTKKRIGGFFGSPILVLDQKINGYPVIQSYAHLNVDSGNFMTYVFDGKQYCIVASVFVEGKSLNELFKVLAAFKKVKAPPQQRGS